MSTWTFATSAVSVIKKISNRSYWKRNLFSIKLLKKILLKYDRFFLFKISADLVEFNLLKFRSNLVETSRTEFISENSLNLVPISVVIFYRFNNWAHCCKNTQCFFLNYFHYHRRINSTSEYQNGFFRIQRLDKINDESSSRKTFQKISWFKKSFWSIESLSNLVS